MQKSGSTVHFSASDLVWHLNCRFMITLDLKVVNGVLEKPKVWDASLNALVERGRQHELGYVEHLKTAGATVTVVDGVGVDQSSVLSTRQAMARGDAIIVQGALQAGLWSGRADILQRVEWPSALGVWSYEVVDTKLARETKGNTVLQISLYSDLLAEMQDVVPVAAHVVTPGTNYAPETFRVADYAAYYRRVRQSLEQFVANPCDESLYPEPIEHCEICRWREHCDRKRRADDHMSLVAGISKTQIAELNRRGIAMTAALAKVPLPLQWRPDRGAAESYVKVREQARIQVEGRQKGSMAFERLKLEPGFGLFRLPERSPGDIFFDFEGDPFVEDGGLEFLFGYLYSDANGSQRYVGDWVTNRQEERAAFERFVDFVIDRLKTYPNLHIYHFAPYEPAALKRLMGRYATREDEVDALLRAEVFVDLFAIVRHAIRASVESYSIKKLEPLYNFKRSMPLVDVGAALARVQTCLELGDVGGITDEDKAATTGYNHDDCASTSALRDWLESLRDEWISRGEKVDRPQPKTPEVSPDLNDWKRRAADLVARLTAGISDDVAERSAEQQARWLLAHLVDFHGRENKAVWWEYFRLRDLSAENLLHERAGLAELTYLEPAGGTAKAPVHRYRFVAQETDIRAESNLYGVGGKKLGSVAAMSLDDRTVDIKKRRDSADIHPEAIFTHRAFDHDEQAEAIFRIGEYVATHGIDGPGDYRAARDLLLRIAPRLIGQKSPARWGASVGCGQTNCTLSRSQRSAGAGAPRRGQDLRWGAHDLRACKTRTARWSNGKQPQGDSESLR